MTYPSPPRRGRRVRAVRAPRSMVPDHYWSHHAPMAPLGHALAQRRHIRAYRHHSLAGPREPAAPGTSIPHHCHSRQPHLPAIPPKRREPPRPAIPSSQPSFPRKRASPSPRGYGGTIRGQRTVQPTPRTPKHPPTHTPTPPPIPCVHSSRLQPRRPRLTTDGRQCASCHPGTDPPVTHHHGHGRLAPNPPPCPTASSLRRRPQSTSPRAAEGP